MKLSSRSAVKNMLGPVLVLLALGAWGVLIYADTLKAPFQFDDGFFITGNEAIKNLGDIQPLFGENYRRRIVTFLTFALNYHFHGHNVTGYHVLNLALHIITTMLVWCFVRQILTFSRLDQEHPISHPPVVAFFAALVFLTHPLQTQAVTYICQRFTILASFFYMVSVCLYIQARRMLLAPKVKEGTVLGIFGAFILATLLGVFSKEILLTLPFTIFLIEHHFLQGSKDFRPGDTGERKRFFYAPFIQRVTSLQYRGVGISVVFLLLAVAVFFLLIAPNFRDLWMDVFFRRISPLKYFLTQFRVIVTYVRLLFVPVQQNADYDFPWAQGIGEPPIILSFIFLVSLIVLALRIRPKNALISFGILWFFITISAESFLFPLPDLIMEHRVYLPMVGFSVVLCAAMGALIKDKGKLILVLSLIVIMFSFLTYQRNKIWQSRLAFWQDVIKKSPRKARAHLNLANTYAQEGDKDSALEHYDKAIAIDPGLAKAHYNKCAFLLNQGKYDLAIDHCHRALILKPHFAEAYYARAVIYRNQGKYAQALNDYRWALIHNPNLTFVYLSRGDLYIYSGQYDLALADIDRALALDPYNAQAYNLRCAAYRLIGDYDLGLEACNRAVAIDPNLPAAYFNRSLIYQAQYRFEEALADADKVQELGQPVDQRYMEFLRDFLHRQKER